MSKKDQYSHQSPWWQNHPPVNTDVLKKNAPASPYYLLWSTGMLDKVAWTGLALTVAHFLVVPHVKWKPPSWLIGSNTAMSPTWGWIYGLVLPMFASACCLLQLLILNALSIGCAGFNKYLGPWRPYFVSLLLYGSMVSKHRFTSHASVVQFFFRWTIALMPELLFAWNHRMGVYPRLLSPKSWTNDDDTATQRKNNTHEADRTIALNVPTMGCVACIHAIQNAISRVEGVESVSSHLNQSGGETIVRLSLLDNSSVLATTEQIIKSMNDSGFPGSTVIDKKS